jgi:hypothetical protein
MVVQRLNPLLTDLIKREVKMIDEGHVLRLLD